MTKPKKKVEKAPQRLILLTWHPDTRHGPRFLVGSERRALAKAAGVTLHLEPEPPSSVTTPVADAPRRGDDYKDWSTEELLGLASKHRFKEVPYPNAGVRRMRILNFIRAHVKET